MSGSAGVLRGLGRLDAVAGPRWRDPGRFGWHARSMQFPDTHWRAGHLRMGASAQHAHASSSAPNGRPGTLSKSKVDSPEREIQVGFKAQGTRENVKTATYGSVIVVGLGITAIVLYNVLSELFSTSSPQKLFQKASEKCVQDPKIQDLLGEPIKAFGEETRRGRRRHVSHMDYVDKAGRKGLRVQFYLQGVRKRATVQIDAREGESGTMKTRFIIASADDLLGTTVVVEDNR
eukprot:maker-scaffold349_size200065-snap-gene-1.22 protein:Tk10536 transcript:maker-scaffold349_size200065-snap-gene-1.22-mRNA-1 annotation:"tim21-like mitochondrial-like"